MKRYWRQSLLTAFLLACLDGSAAGPSRLRSPLHNPSPSGPALLGEWTPVFQTPVMGIHGHLLPNGLVLLWGGDQLVGQGQDAALWDPVSGSTVPVPNLRTNVFCSGHSFLPDGSLVVAGGHVFGKKGLRHTNVYNFASGTWQGGRAMLKARWYPTATTLETGQVMLTSGTDQYSKVVLTPEVGTPGVGWRLLTRVKLSLPLYPWMYLAPNGKVFYAGPSSNTVYITTTGYGAVQQVGPSGFGNRSYGSSVMYEPGKILIVGGGDPPTATAEVIDLNSGTGWRPTSPMAFPRRQLNATVLPDGKVLVTGGTTSPGFSQPAGAVLPAELWDPVTETWTTLASFGGPRLYHSTALLLPDGRILSAGGTTRSNEELTGRHDAEIYSPPYLFQPDGSPAVRPTIATSPGTISYGQEFQVTMPDSQRITQVTLIRLSSVTHAFNQEQRFNRLSFTQQADTAWQQLDVIPADSVQVVSPTEALSITAPATNRLAPPGYYLLFILNDTGTPSVARIVRLS